MTAQQIQRIYSLGAKIGIVGNDRNDDLHALVGALTGKESIKDLTDEDYLNVLNELKKRAAVTVSKPKEKRESSKGMTAGQQGKVWQLMYELEKFDRKPSSAAVGERLCGIIKKEFGIDALPKNPFVWLDYSDGSRLIERLKKYVQSAEKRYLRGG